LLDDHQIALYERHLARTLGQETVTDLPAQANDVIHFDAVFTVNGVVSEEKNVRMFLDTEESNEEFVKNLIGLKAGDEKIFSYQGVPNSFNKIVTGEHVDATVKIIEVSTLIPADRATLKQAQKDEQQEDHEAIMTDEAFDEKLRTDAASLLEQRDFLHNKELFLKTLAEAYSFEIPEAYLSKIEHLSAQDKDKVIKEMRLDLVLNKHMALLKPTVTEKSVEKAIFELMMDKDVPPQLVHNALKNNKNFRESFYHNLLIDDLVRKAIHFIKNPHDEVLIAESKQPHKHHAGCGHDHAS
jgi:FKBP-type peptidyl-prolyl cis-trans isomerase (trigger factor)